MKRSLHIVITLCIGLLIGSASNVFAAIGDVVEATFAEFTFIVDGETKELEADPLVYQGTTYLPIRVVANLLGRDVVYKADSKTESKTIELNTPIVKEAQGSDPTTMTTEQPLDEQLYLIDLQLTTQNEILTEVGKMIENPISEDARIMYQEMIDRATTRIEELEAQKAELEAQQ